MYRKREREREREQKFLLGSRKILKYRKTQRLEIQARIGRGYPEKKKKEKSQIPKTTFFYRDQSG